MLFYEDNSRERLETRFGYDDRGLTGHDIYAETLKIQISITMSDLTDMGIKCATSLFYNVTKYAKIFADLMVIVSRRRSIKYIEATQ